MKIILYIWLIFLSASQLIAQQPVIRFQHLTLQNGLSQGNVLCMLQDKEGYIWIGTFYGLNCYNGYSIKSYSKIAGDSTSLCNNVVYSLFEDKDGIIWVGTSAGLDKFNKKSETFEHITSYKPGNINDDTFTASQAIWIVIYGLPQIRVVYVKLNIAPIKSHILHPKAWGIPGYLQIP